jgi:hypothetical protein
LRALGTDNTCCTIDVGSDSEEEEDEEEIE